MAVSEDAVAVLAAKFAVMRKVADERTWRVYLGSEALALGRGGIRAVALAAGGVARPRWPLGCPRSGPVSWTGCRRDGPGGRERGGGRPGTRSPG